jgi:hypothetical protein
MSKKLSPIIIVLAAIVIIIAGGLLIWTQSKKINQPTLSNQKDERILYAPKISGEMFETFGRVGYNCAQPNMFETYQNKEKGIIVKLPYNQNWGDTKYKANIYDDINNNIVAFGCLVNDPEAGAIKRQYYLNFLPAKSVDKVMADLAEWENPVKIEVNNLTVVKYTQTKLCSHPTLQVIGDKFNYEFTYQCGQGLEEEFNILESVVQSIEFVE